MQAILEFLNGKKTYVMGIIYALDAFGSQLGWWSADTARTVIEQVLALFALRAGVTKVETTVK